jgi:hypothetical protein
VGCRYLMPIILLGRQDQQDQGSRPAWANSSGDPTSKIITAKWTRGVGQVEEYLLCKSKDPSSNSSTAKRLKKKWQSTNPFLIFCISTSFVTVQNKSSIKLTISEKSEPKTLSRKLSGGWGFSSVEDRLPGKYKALS